MEATPRKELTHSNDLTVPINGNKVMAFDREQHGESCFSHLWDMTNGLCALCADSEMCGIMFHKRQKKAVKAMEESMTSPLDVVDFDVIDKDDLMIWLKIKPRRTGELAEKVSQMVKCDDVETIRFWVKSFIKDSPKLAVQNGVIVIKN